MKIAGVICLTVALCALGFIVYAQDKGSQLKTDDKELKKAFLDGYAVSLSANDDAVKIGNNIVPLLSELLSERIDPDERMEEGHELSSYPYNVIWALAQIGGPEAKKALETNMDIDKDLVRFALKAVEIREELKDPKVGIFYDLYYGCEKNAILLKEPRETSGEITKIRCGEGIRLIGMTANPNEMGPRGGDQKYAEIELLDGGLKGFYPLAGIGFSPKL